MVSPGWIASVSCQEEVRAFQGIAVISVLTLDVVDTMPEGLRRYQWEEFFTVDEKGVDRTFLAQDRGEFKRGIETIAASIVRLLALPAPQTIERTRETARSHVAPIIGQRCGTTRILDMERPIDSDAIYTRVNLLERVTGRRRKTLAELKAEFKLKNSDALAWLRQSKLAWTPKR